MYICIYKYILYNVSNNHIFLYNVSMYVCMYVCIYIYIYIYIIYNVSNNHIYLCNVSNNHIFYFLGGVDVRDCARLS